MLWTHFASSNSYSPAVEACLTKDFVIPTTTFAHYMQQSQAEKAKAFADGMRRRTASTFLFLASKMKRLPLANRLLTMLQGCYEKTD